MLNSARRCARLSSVKSLALPQNCLWFDKKYASACFYDRSKSLAGIDKLKIVPNHGRCYSFMQVFNKLRNSQGPDPVESPRLTPHMVTQILQMNERNLILNKGSPDSIIKEVQCNQLQVIPTLCLYTFQGMTICISIRNLKIAHTHWEIVKKKLLYKIKILSILKNFKLFTQVFPYKENFSKFLAILHY